MVAEEEARGGDRRCGRESEIRYLGEINDLQELAGGVFRHPIGTPS